MMNTLVSNGMVIGLSRLAGQKRTALSMSIGHPERQSSVVAEILNSTIGSGKVFAMDRLMPFKKTDGSEIPSYQAYLVLGWFRMLSRAGTRKGRIRSRKR